MPHYIVLGNWTDQGIRNVKESPKRVDTAQALLNKLGGKMEIFFTLGEYDFVALAEAPNDEVVTQLALEIGRAGNVRTKSLKAFSVAEATKIISKLSP